MHEATEEHYGDYPRRIHLHALASINKIDQDVISMIRYLFKPLALIAEWRRGNKANVLKTLCAACVYVARLMSKINKDDSLMIRDERTDKKVRLPFVNHLSNTLTDDDA